MATKPDLPYQTRVVVDFERKNFGNANDLRPARVVPTNTSSPAPAPAPASQNGKKG